MSTPTSRPAATACDHCDTSVPHEHLDVRAVVADARSRARRTALLQAGVATLAVVGAVMLAIVHGEVRSVWTAVATAAGWSLITVLGLAVAGSVSRRRGEGASLVVGVLTAAAALPLLALVLTALSGGGVVTAAVAAATWLTCAATAEVLRARAWRRLLLEPGEAGEQARGRAVSDRGEHRTVEETAGWLLPAVFLGVAVLLLGAVPALVVVLVPLAVALTALRAKATAA